MNQQDFLQLVEKYLQGKACEEEKELLFNHYNSFQKAEEWNETELGSRKEVEEKILRQLTEAIQSKERVVPLHKHAWIKVAAAVIILLGGSAVWIVKKGTSHQIVERASKSTLQTLDASKTTLVLADGEVIQLHDSKDGLLRNKEGALIRKRGDTVVFVIQNALQANEAAAGLNEIKASKGHQCKLVLSDGSQVWVNAATTLRFPTVFKGNERKVEVAGEAYFEVAKNAKMPFRVYASSQVNDNANGVLVEVLGTHFNINSYHDEAMMKTTLVEGSVRISPFGSAQNKGSNTKILSPGQQALLSSRSSSDDYLRLKVVDVEEVVAWKNNVFNFNSADIQTIMRQIARWYDVEVEYEGKIPVRSFSGKISRKTTLSIVLQILEQSNIHFRVQGRKIIVKP